MSSTPLEIPREVFDVSRWIRGKVVPIYPTSDSFTSPMDEPDNEIFYIFIHPGEELFDRVIGRMQETIVPHNSGIPLNSFKFQAVFKIQNEALRRRFEMKKAAIERKLGTSPEVWEAFHGSPKAKQIAKDGFDVSYSKVNSMFGQGIYMAANSSKANQYTFGKTGDTLNGCQQHNEKACKQCTRRILMCKCIMGKKFRPTGTLSEIPGAYDSVVANPADNAQLATKLKYPEYVIRDGNQILPYVMIEYTI